MHVLFTVALRDPARSKLTRAQLESDRYAKSSDPIARSWANQTLVLLALADQAHTATASPQDWDKISNRLSSLSQFSQTLEGVFGEDVYAAAAEALSWMEQCATREKE